MYSQLYWYCSVLYQLGWLDYIGVQTTVPDLDILECFGSSVLTPSLEFCRKSQISQWFLVLQVVQSHFREFEALFWKVWLQRYRYQLFRWICAHTCFRWHSSVCFDLDSLLWLSAHLCSLSIWTHFLFPHILHLALLACGNGLKLQILGDRWEEQAFGILKRDLFQREEQGFLVNLTFYQRSKFSESPRMVTGIVTGRPCLLVSESTKYLVGLETLAVPLSSRS